MNPAKPVLNPYSPHPPSLLPPSLPPSLPLPPPLPPKPYTLNPKKKTEASEAAFQAWRAARSPRLPELQRADLEAQQPALPAEKASLTNRNVLNRMNASHMPQPDNDRARLKSECEPTLCTLRSPFWGSLCRQSPCAAARDRVGHFQE